MDQSEEMNRWSDEKLLRAAGEGNEAAFVILAKRWIYIFRFLLVMCRNNRLPEGVATTLALQTVRVAVAESIGRPFPAGHDRWNWLQEIASQEFRKWFTENRQVLPKSSASFSGQPPGQGSAPKANGPSSDCVGKYLKWLPEDHRDLIEMVMLKGMTVDEAGKTIGWDAKRSCNEFISAHRMIVSYIKEHGCD